MAGEFVHQVVQGRDACPASDENIVGLFPESRKAAPSGTDKQGGRTWRGSVEDLGARSDGLHEEVEMGISSLAAVVKDAEWTAEKRIAGIENFHHEELSRQRRLIESRNRETQDPRAGTDWSRFGQGCFDPRYISFAAAVVTPFGH